MNQRGEEYKIVDNFVITQTLLGRGAFGTVYRGYKKDNPQEIVAVKVIPISVVNKNKNFTKLLKRELDILPKIDNQYITKFINRNFDFSRLLHASRTANNFYMFLEYCNGGDLKKLLTQRQYLSEQESLTYFRHIVEGFKGIYQENVIHRDIKPANILLHNSLNQMIFYIFLLDKAKISDFGFARVVDDMEEVDIFTLLGTPLYMAPQILDGEKFSSKGDIWSLGMLFYELLYGKTPWNANSQQNLSKMIKNQPLSFPTNLARSQKIKDLISRMLQIKEEDRISWPDIFNHELVKENEAVLLKQMQDITSSELDDLEKSQQLNQLYLDKNKVITQGERNIQIQNFFLQNNKNLEQAETGSIQSSQNQDSVTDINQNMEYKQIIEAQNQQLHQRETILRIDQYLGLKRNTGIFVNFTTNSIFKLFKEGVIKFPYHLFYRIIFLLQKHQMIIFQELIDIMASKIQLDNGISQKDWKNYRNSQEYFATLQSIKSDNAYIKPYFSEIYQRTQEYLSNLKQNLTPEDQKEDCQIKEFLMILTKEFKMDIQFRAIYEKTLKQVLKYLAEFVLKEKQFRENRIALQTAKFLKICVDPQAYFKWNQFNLNGAQAQPILEFNKFYEDYENINLHSLLMEVKEDLKEFFE